MDWSAAAKVLLISAIPFLELRMGIPVGMGAGLSPREAIVLGILGNLVQVPMVLGIMYLLRRIAQQVPMASKLLARLDALAERNQQQVRRYGWLGLALFVGIPIPGTGIWTGAALANLVRMPLALAAIALGVGVAVSGLVVGAVSTGAFSVIRSL